MKGPSGEVVTYSYASMPTQDLAGSIPVLASVTRGGSTVSYGYTITPVIQQPNAFLGETQTTVYHHVDIGSITDERNNAYTFTYEPNLSVYYTELVQNATLVLPHRGLPSLLKSVTLPGGGATTTFDVGSTRNIVLGVDGILDANVVHTSVRGPCGTYDYDFSAPNLFRHFLPDPGDEGEATRRFTLTFTRLELTSAAGTEIFVLNPNAGMALAYGIDVNGNRTDFYYTEAWTGQDNQGGFYDDPTSEVSALGTKFFSYDGNTRIMKSVTDERGVNTSYDIQTDTGLRTQETVTDPELGTLKITDFAYGSGGFAGFLHQQTVRQGTGAAAEYAPAIVTTFTSDSNGRVASESVAVGSKQLKTCYTYTPSGSKATVTDPNGHTTSFTYDSASLRLTAVTYPGGAEKQLHYDQHGNLDWEINENDVKTLHQYDALNRRILSAVDTDGNDAVSARATTSLSPAGGETLARYNGDIVTNTTYNAFNLPVKVTDARGLVTKHEYDAIGRLTKIIVNPDIDEEATSNSLVTTFDYSGPNSGGSIFDVTGFKPTSSTSPRGVITEVDYDQFYRATETRVKHATLGTVKTTTVYDAVGNPNHVTDDLLRTTVTHFDGLHRAYRVDLPHSGDVPAASRHVYFTPSGKPWKSVDEAGRESLTRYDSAGRPVEAWGPVLADLSRPNTKTYYDAASNVIAVTDPRGYTTETGYDARNRPIVVTAPPVTDAGTGQSARPETSTTYDDLGNVLTVTDPLGHTVTKHYDRAGRVAQVTDPLGHTTSNICDAAGNVLTVTDPRGKITTNVYDTLGRLVGTVDATPATTTFAYDKAGNRTRVEDGKHNVTTFVYDGLNRVLLEHYANGDQTSYTYDAARKLTRTDAAGTSHYSYDLRDRIRTVSPPGAPVRTYSYNAANQLLSVTETGNAAANVVYTYDGLGRVLSETSRGQTHTYTYDVVGNRLTTAYATGRSEARAYDGQNRIVSLTEGGRVTTWHYDLAGRAVTLLPSNGQQQDNYYDAAGRLTERLLFDDVGQWLAAFQWSHDEAGNVTQQTERWAGVAGRGGVRTTDMSYDNVNRLLTETVTADGQPAKGTTYIYDDAGNRQTKVESEGGAILKNTIYTYNEANQLKVWSEKDGQNVVQREAALDYDTRGNRTSQTLSTFSAQPSTELTSYAWTSENRLASVTLPSGRVHAYKYDYRMRRITRSEPGAFNTTVHTAMTYSGGLSVAEYAVDAPPSSIQNPASSNVEYARGPDMGGGVGGLLYSIRPSTNPSSNNPSIHFNLSNGRGDVVAQSDPTGALTWTASYEAYGKRPVETGANADRQRANTKEEDPTGLLNEGFRYRDIETGVWLSRDPAGFVDGPNLYAYVQQNPWTKFDPKGLWAEAGHFYTTYTVAMAANVPQHRAFALAYYSQIPDEVNRFDATEVAMDAGKAQVNVANKMGANKVSGGLLPGPSHADMGDAGTKTKVMESVQKGLHFLNGADDAQITKAKSNMAGAIKGGEFSGDWQTGFAIHTFGDIYAHTQDAGGGKLKGYDTGRGHLADGKAPDHITSSAANTAKYEEYVAALYTALGGKGSAAANPEITALLDAARKLPKPWNRGTGHGRANDAMHKWFVGKYGEAAMNGYDPRPEHATSNGAGLTIPATSDVDAHSTKTQKILER